ncbi:MAG: hypothetical protein Q4C25_06365, partial [Bacillota bacterium]|nr:hypothetical protein [Bacillota bacterium]
MRRRNGERQPAEQAAGQAVHKRDSGYMGRIAMLLLCVMLMVSGFALGTGTEAYGDGDDTPKKFYLKIGEDEIVNTDDPNKIESVPYGTDELYKLDINEDATQTVTGVTLTLKGNDISAFTGGANVDIKTLGPIVIRGFHNLNGGSGTFTIDQEDKYASVILGEESAVRTYGTENDKALVAIDADSNLKFTGGDKCAIAALGGVYCGGIDNSIPGNLSLDSGALSLLGMSLSDVSSGKSDNTGGAMIHVTGSKTGDTANNNGKFTLAGGTLTAIGLGADWDALYVEGDMAVNGGGFHQLLSVFGNGGTITGTLTEGANGQVLMGATMG